MSNFESKHFKKLEFTQKQLDQYFSSAERALEIAVISEIPEVIFKFSYDGLIKLGICLIAHKGYKIRSIPGHHIKIIETLGSLLEDIEVSVIANEMRQKRNKELYDGGILLTEKDTAYFRDFTVEAFEKASLIINM